MRCHPKGLQAAELDWPLTRPAALATLSDPMTAATAWYSGHGGFQRRAWCFAAAALVYRTIRQNDTFNLNNSVADSLGEGLAVRAGNPVVDSFELRRLGTTEVHGHGSGV